MPIDTYEDLPKSTNEELIEFLREQIIVILEVAGQKNRLFMACFNTILNEIEKRLKEK